MSYYIKTYIMSVTGSTVSFCEPLGQEKIASKSYKSSEELRENLCCSSKAKPNSLVPVA